MAEAANAANNIDFNPMLLQTNLNKALMLWQTFCSRLAAAQLDGSQTPADNSAFLKSLSNWANNLLQNPEALMQANMAYFTQQTELMQRVASKT